ncbi:MAG: hypothetical protein LH478_04450 [Chitinophagaceae bacterium]|nr:hypothetical protein [Chitinophagaceae bacterium]
MKLVIYLLLAAPLLMTACKKSNIANGTPACIKNNIEANKNKTDWYVGSVEEYKYQGKLVYAFNPENKVIADGATSILTSECTPLCQVGGFGGPAINLCNGENFFQKAVLVRKIWNKY